MRTIKFRGKRLDNGKWMQGDLVHLPDDKIGIAFNPSDIGFVPCAKVDPETVGQYVGICDSNGTEIYEGDIIKTSYGDTDDLIVVRFVRGVFAFLWNDNLDDELPTNAPTQEWATVIGSIHDNPKLLKGGKR